jgi:hypothetical protein
MIVLGFYEGHSLLSKIIKWETRSTISHVSVMQMPDTVYDPFARRIRWVVLRSALEHCRLWEAWASAGVVERKGIHEGHKPGTVIHLMRLETGLTCDEPSALKFLEAAVAARLKYDWWGLARFGLRIDRQDESRMFCSELAALAMVAARLPLLRRVEAHFVAPGDLHRSPLLTELLTVRTENAPKGPVARRGLGTAVGPENGAGKTCNGLQSQKTPVPSLFRLEAVRRKLKAGFRALSADSSTGGNARFAETRESVSMQHGKGLVRA